MKIVRLFVASSIDEFKTERIIIGNFVCRINSSSNDTGYYVRLFLCEDESSNMQRVYDDEIVESNIFIALIGEHLGRWTRHEIEDIALHSTHINRRIIFTKGTVGLPKDWSDKFEVQTICADFINNILKKIFTTFETVQEELPDQAIPLTRNIIFTINTPNSGKSLIDAIIGNIIRSYNDQQGDFYNIRIETDLTNQLCDSYLAVFSEKKEYEDEEHRVLRIIGDNIPIESLWAFANSNMSEVSIVRVLREKYNKYVDLFVSNDDFSSLFKIRLINAILDKIRLDNKINALFFQGFCYIVEDHFLKRVSLTNSNNKVVIKNLYNIDSDLEIQCRKERIIANCMNMYHTTPGKMERYKEALYALERGSYDFFLSDLGEVTGNAIDGYEKFVDYIIESALLLQRVSWTKKEEEIVNGVNEICVSIKRSRYNLEMKDNIRIFNMLGDILKEYPLQIEESEKYYSKAISSFIKKQEYDDLSIVNTILGAIINECEINYRKNNDEIVVGWVNKGYGMLKTCSSNTHFDISRYKFKLLVYGARACRNINYNYIEKNANELIDEFDTTIVSADKLYEEAEKLIKNKYKENNASVDLYIKLIYEISVNRLMNEEGIGIYQQIIEELKKANNKYLNATCEYPAEYILANRYIDFLVAVTSNDFPNMEIIINSITEDRLLNQSNQGFLDMLYVYSQSLRKNSKHNEAVIILDYLIDNYIGKRDIAICLQNKALSHMCLYKQMDELKRAEKAYLESLKLFVELDESANVGNVNDGLSFCYILQKDFVKARTHMGKTIKNNKYNVSNKYANYLSFLMCSGHFLKACGYFYFRIKDRDGVRKVLKQDWSNQSEMSYYGFDVNKFNKMFVVYDFLHGNRSYQEDKL